MAKFRVTQWSDYAVMYEVEAESEDEALRKIENEGWEYEVDTYYGDTRDVDVEEVGENG